MKFLIFITFCSFALCAQSCNNLRFSGSILDAKIVENKDDSYIVKLITNNNLFYIETDKQFFANVQDSVFICWVDYSKSYLILSHKKYSIIRRYIEH